MIMLFPIFAILCQHAAMEASRLGTFLISEAGIAACKRMKQSGVKTILIFSTNTLQYYLTAESIFVRCDCTDSGFFTIKQSKIKPVFYSELVCQLLELQGLREFQLVNLVQQAFRRGGFL